MANGGHTEYADADVFQEHVEKARIKSLRWQDPERTILYNTIGLTEEAGEIAGEIKRFMRGGTIVAPRIKAEIGDLLWYVARLCTELDFDLSEIMAGAIDKAEERGRAKQTKGEKDE